MNKKHRKKSVYDDRKMRKDEIKQIAYTHNFTITEFFDRKEKEKKKKERKAE